ncbi:MSP (Major sperm protein) domain family protein [Brugia pahangi]
MTSVTSTTVSPLSREEPVASEYPRYMTEHFYHSNLFTTLLLLTIIYLLSGNYSLILCNVLCTLPPGILTYFQMTSKDGIIKKSIIVYWIICGISFTFDTISASISSYSYFKTITLMLLFHYCMMENVENKSLPFGNVRNLSHLKRTAKEWVSNKRSQHGRTSENITSDLEGHSDTTLGTLKTVPKESCTAATGLSLSITKSNSTRTAAAGRSCSSRIARTGRLLEEERTETVEQSFNKNYQLTNYMGNSRNNMEGLVSFPDSQITIRNDNTEPVILAFTNNYKKSVIWALKTNAIRRFAAFPTTGIIPPSETVQIKIDFLGQISKKNLNDRLSLEYFVTDRKFISDTILDDDVALVDFMGVFLVSPESTVIFSLRQL